MRKRPLIKYTDMCIYIDNHIYEESHDVEKIFEYLQCLFYALSFKKHFFNKESDYDNYSIYAATQVYQRLVNKKQFLPDDDPNKLDRIKSVLNYIKSVMQPLRVNYQQDYFHEIYTDEYQSDNIQSRIKEDIKDTIINKNHSFVETDVTLYFKNIPNIIKDFLRETPYSKNPRTFKNLYTSCLITLLRSITISNQNKMRIINSKTGEYKSNIDSVINTIYYEESLHAPIQWNLGHGYDTLVAVFTNKIKKLIAQDIRDIMQVHEMSDDIITDIMMSPMIDVGDNDE